MGMNVNTDHESTKRATVGEKFGGKGWGEFKEPMWHEFGKNNTRNIRIQAGREMVVVMCVYRQSEVWKFNKKTCYFLSFNFLSIGRETLPMYLKLSRDTVKISA